MLWLFLGTAFLILQRSFLYNENPFYLFFLFLFSFWLFLLAFKSSRKRVFSYLLVILIFLLAENIRGGFEKGSFFTVLGILFPSVFVRDPEGVLNFLSFRLPKNLLWLEFSISIFLTFLLFFLNYNPKPSLPLLAPICLYSNSSLWNGIFGNLLILSFTQKFHHLVFSLFLFWVIYPILGRGFPLSFILGLGLGLIFSKLQ